MKHNCRWVLSDGTYCEKPVRYTIIKDDDGNPVRKYNTFCDYHLKLAEEQDNCEEDD